MAHKLVTGADLYNGFKFDKGTLLGGAIDDLLPFQMLTLEEKTPDWIHAVADYYEVASWNNVEKKAGKIQKNFWMRHGKLDQSDYILNPNVNSMAHAIGMIVPPESQSPLEQFYTLAPNLVDVMRGEFLKRENSWTILAIDPYSKNSTLQQKQQQFQDILLQQALLQKQQALVEMGITPETDPQQFQQGLEEVQQRLTQVEFESRNLRTVGEQWAEKVLGIHEKRYNLHELEPDAFECSLICDREFWHLDLLDDDFKLELLNPKWCDYHKGPNVKYVSDGDYFAWFDFMSAGDVVNKYGRRMSEEDILKMKEVYYHTANLIVPDAYKNRQGAYYDYRKPWTEATDLNPALNDALLGKELAYNFMRSPNFDHNQDVDILNPVWGRLTTGHPQMFRVMNLYWRALRRIGWLTKINRDGSRAEPQWVDENYRVTVKPKYDNSVVKENKKDNLLYGEHIDWTWVPEWRRVIKIAPNAKHTFWVNAKQQMEAIYIDGGPTKFQFRGINNPFDSLPPVEGCEFSYWNTTPHSFIDRIKPMQVLYNICMNKIPKKFLNDYGNKIAIHRGMMLNQNIANEVGDTIDPIEAYEDKLINSPILDYTMDREMMAGQLGQPPLPTVLQLSTIQEAQLYFQLGQAIKWEAGEIVGITRQRAGAAKATETAQSIQQGTSFSETQTEKYYEQHANLMQRVRQRMLDAAQYYSTFNDTNLDVYMNTDEERMFLEITGMENTLPQYNLFLESKTNVRASLQKISKYLEANNTLPIPASAYINAMVENSLPKLRNLIRKGELEQQEQTQLERDHEMQLEQKRQEALQMQWEHQLQLQKQKDDAAYQRETDVAEIRAAGGMQTDVNANAVPDAQENLDFIIRQQEMQQGAQQHQTSENLKRQTELDKLNVQREVAAMKLEGDKYKADATVKVAKINPPAGKTPKKKT